MRGIGMAQPISAYYGIKLLAESFLALHAVALLKLP